MGWGALLLILPSQHEYPVVDDWLHAVSVRTMLETGTFRTPPSVQISLLGLTVWGAAWTKLFGFSFTTLTYSTLVMELAALFAFYGIARLFDVAPAGALLGTALLAFNPLFVHLSYSFMSDVPFLALMLIASYCYLRGIQRRRLVWLWWGSFFASWSFLIRQLGLLVPLAFVLYVALTAAMTRSWRWREMIAIVAIPATIVAAWYLVIRPEPTPGELVGSRQRARFLLKELWLRVFLLRALALLPVTALSAWSALTLRSFGRWLILPWFLALTYGAYALDLPTEAWIRMPEPPFTARIGPLAFDLPQESFSFGGTGNIVRITGIDFFEYRQEPIWTAAAWRGLWLLGMLLGAVLLAKATESLLHWLKDCRQRPPLPPVAGFYLLGVMIFMVSVGFVGRVYDRYLLAFLPFLIVFVVRGSGQWGRLAWSYSGLALAVLATFTLLAKADHIDHANARWEAAQWMERQVGRVQVGYEWNNWVAPGSRNYEVTDLHINNFRTERRFPYLSRLSGFRMRYVLAESRANVPPLSGSSP